MATVESHQVECTAVEMLVGLKVCYQKHKPGTNLILERLPKEAFRIDSVNRFGTRIVVNDGAVIMEGVPTVMMRKRRVAFLLPSGEELYFTVE